MKLMLLNQAFLFCLMASTSLYMYLYTCMCVSFPFSPSLLSFLLGMLGLLFYMVVLKTCFRFKLHARLQHSVENSLNLRIQHVLSLDFASYNPKTPKKKQAILYIIYTPNIHKYIHFFKNI